jgi:predicted nucleotidyltransferase
VTIASVTATLGYLDAPATRYARAVTEALHETLDGSLVGVYLYGSGTVGDFVVGRSDVDLVAVSAQPLEAEEARLVAGAVWDLEIPYPTKGLDLHLVPLESAATALLLPPYELQMLTAYDFERVSQPGDAAEPRLNMHFVCCRRHGYALAGPDPRKVFAPRPRPWYLEQLREELFRSMTRNPVYRILNGCRDWRYIDENVICSKIAGGEWALERLEEPWIVEAALCRYRTGDRPQLADEDVEAFVEWIAELLQRSLEEAA